MIKITIDEALYGEISSKALVGLPSSEVMRLEGDIITLDDSVRNMATTGQEGPNSYAVDLPLVGSGPSPFTSELGGLRHVHMKGGIGTLVLENGDILVYDGTVMLNHSALIRGMQAAFAVHYAK